MSTMRCNLGLWPPVVGWALVIFVLNSIPNPPAAPPGPVPIDKVVHFVEYFVLGALIYRAAPGARWRRPIAWALALGISYGALDEFHQVFIPTRFADLGDAATDGAGVVAGALILSHTHRRKKVGSLDP